jgi:glutathione synthase/RimK-type ligase-like ATP-grasp enzyme
VSRRLIVVDRAGDFPWPDLGHDVALARDYIARRPDDKNGPDRVINLSRNYDYLGLGYYVSLMAEARGAKVLPTVESMLELGRKSLYALRLSELDDLLKRNAKALAGIEGTQFSVRAYFGRPTDPRFGELARRAFALFRAPLLKLELALNGAGWRVGRVGLMTINELPVEERPAFLDALTAYAGARWITPRPRPSARYDLGVLHDPAEKFAPSNRRALARFVEVGQRMGVNVQLIGRSDYDRIAEFDALFIRETTALDNHTFRFARKAQAEGIPVIDDPLSIQRCTNKVYLAELLASHNVAGPQTVILTRDSYEEVESRLVFPVVLKVPDGSFSRGVFKAKDPAHLRELAGPLLKDSSVLLAQEFLPTAFDWRVGVLNRKPIFACQYFMSRNHWQVVKHASNGAFQEGRFATLPVEDAPADVVALGVKAAGLIGDGFYGVDLKQTEHGPVVIEVNDNPNVDAGIEDKVLKDELYRLILDDFIRRIEQRRSRTSRPSLAPVTPQTAAPAPLALPLRARSAAG